MSQGTTDSSARLESSSADGSSSRKGMKVLVVDDDAAALIPTVSMFQVMGYDALAARTADEALALVKAHPDLTVLVAEVDLQPVDGVTLARRAQSIIPGIKVVLVSEYPAATMDSGHGSPSENFHLLHKPLQLSEVAIVLRR